MKISGIKLAKITSFKKEVYNNHHNDLRKFKGLYVLGNIKGDFCWAEFAYIKLSKIEKMKPFAIFELSSMLKATGLTIVKADDGEELIQLRWD